jgi:hypothetical protein
MFDPEETTMGAERSDSLRKLAAVARRQHGLFTYRQVLDRGISKASAYRQRQARLWLEVEPLVYRNAASEPLTWQQRTLALVLSTGGIASGRSAAALYGLVDPPRAPEVIVRRELRSCRHRRPDVRSFGGDLHGDMTHVDGIPAATPSFALITLGDVVSREALRDAVDAAVVRRLVTPRRLAARATALWAPRRKGCAAVLEALRSAHPELWRTRSEWEAKVLRVLGRTGAPDPIPDLEVLVGGQRRVIDFAWPDAMVALEFDGFVPHTTRRVFDDDRERQNLLVDAGWRIYRVTATLLRRRPDAALAPLLRALQVNG